MTIEPQDPTIAECEEMALPARWHALQASMWLQKDVHVGNPQMALLVAQTHALTAIGLFLTEPAPVFDPPATG